MRVDYSPFEGKRVIGAPAAVLSRGELIVADDQWVGAQKQGRGQFVRRGTFRCPGVNDGALVFDFKVAEHKPA